MRLLFFSDIHYAQYSSGVTLEDVENVEKAITECAVKERVDLVLFGGDRFLSHTPPDYVRLVADRCQRDRNDLGIVTFSLIGNHDWWGKSSVTGHSNRFVQSLWPDRHPNLVIMDAPTTYQHPKLPQLLIHAVPASFHIADASFAIDPAKHNILVFHDLLMGAIIDVQTQYAAPRGIHIGALDRPEFDCVLGGDVHIPQKLPFAQTRGGYCGSPIQQSRRDRGGENGWLLIELESDFSKSAQERKFSSTFVSSPCPRFVECGFDRIPTPEQVEEVIDVHYGDVCQGNIVTVFVEGPQSLLEQMTPQVQIDLEHALKARKVKLVFKLKQNDVAPVIPVSSGSLLADYEDFLHTRQLEGLDIESLSSKAQDTIRKARQ
jgi:DNA repair exonuclease SbcCD nuclease subunit